MKEAAFQELLTSARQAGRIRRGRTKPSRDTTFAPADVKAVRAKLGQPQKDFAPMIGMSVATLRNWEQGWGTPDGAALALLRMAARNPAAVAEALHRPRAVRHNDVLELTADAMEYAPARCARRGIVVTRLQLIAGVRPLTDSVPPR